MRHVAAVRICESVLCNDSIQQADHSQTECPSFSLSSCPTGRPHTAAHKETCDISEANDALTSVTLRLLLENGAAINLSAATKLHFIHRSFRGGERPELVLSPASLPSVLCL